MRLSKVWGCVKIIVWEPSTLLLHASIHGTLGCQHPRNTWMPASMEHLDASIHGKPWRLDMLAHMNEFCASRTWNFYEIKSTATKRPMGTGTQQQQRRTHSYDHLSSLCSKSPEITQCVLLDFRLSETAPSELRTRVGGARLRWGWKLMFGEDLPITHILRGPRKVWVGSYPSTSR